MAPDLVRPSDLSSEDHMYAPRYHFEAMLEVFLGLYNIQYTSNEKNDPFVAVWGQIRWSHEHRRLAIGLDVPHEYVHYMGIEPTTTIWKTY